MEHTEDARSYFDLLDLPGGDPSKAQVAALTRAHDLRKFEIENYWKRSTYFWGFQLVSFGALALSAKDGKFETPLVLIISVLGTLAAWTGVLTARGSKFWQANWESHVDFLENAVEGNLHKIAIADRDIEFSVSRVNERFVELLFLGWIIAFVASACTLIWPQLLHLSQSTASLAQLGITGFALLAGLTRLTWGQRSKLRGRVYKKSNGALLLLNNAGANDLGTD